MPYVIDLFCGAGGFSEGIIQAGFDIVFSSDKSSEVMTTYKNRHQQLGLIEGENTHFELADIRQLTGDNIFKEINKLKKYKNMNFERGDIDVTFGGPPCQGFSRAGKRDSSDPRNMLFHEYLRIIHDVYPKYVVMENVEGFMDMQMLDFPSVLSKNKIYEGQRLAKDILETELKGLGYNMLEPKLLNASDYGVPQNRKRAVFLAWRDGMKEPEYPTKINQKVTVKEALSGIMNNYRSEYARQSKFGRTPNTIGNYISATRINNQELSTHTKSVIQRFSIYNQGESTRMASERLKQTGLDLLNDYPELFFETLFNVNKSSNMLIIEDILQELEISLENSKKERWLGDTNKVLSILFMARPKEEIYHIYLSKLKNRIHSSEETTQKFLNICHSRLNRKISLSQLSNACISGSGLTDDILEALFTKKNSRKRLDSLGQAPTMVTLPDDFIHPFENRILTVREMARLQSFDDSFEFLGKRTTGGDKRKQEVPQYTQVGNAVPPLMANAIANSIMDSLNNN
ncbi:DNA cytosine methyltransferase [Enterococcus ureasiticus]|uniref:DNA cytosine methyltransferase n=1 Tax=Enterococcus ureasiticus TaxID=903984 RepID=UPI001A8C1B89|nr:DNA cytosine methyltransferase [Enterococcus ureasiticus]MBO0474691.1 DNA cytosine methyltransferase [Enterococcus ureasiticus]